MVPQKIIIEGFLCYRTRQEIDLSDLRLCMLAGPNGSGKSAVFDAITFALFGIHRGGARNAEDLINKKCDSARVIFEFLLDGKPWQIYRTIRRSSRGVRCTSDVRRPSTKSDTGDWDVVPDTSSADGLASWVASKLALSGKAFTRSMLLRQGESDRLLSADTKERFEVLVGIAELEKFQELETSANDRRRRTEGEAAKLMSQLDGIVKVSETDLDQATQQAQAAADHLGAADELIASLQERYLQAMHWFDLKGKLDLTKQKRQRAEGLIKDAIRIEAEYQQLTSLAAALPHLVDIHDRQERIAKSRERIQTWSDQGEQRQPLLETANKQAKTAQDSVSLVEPLIPELEAHQSALASKIAESRRVLDAADATEQQRKSLRDIDNSINKLVTEHPNPDTELKDARDNAARLVCLSGALPTLERFAESRRNATEAAKRRIDAEAAKQTSSAEAEAAIAQHQSLQNDLQLADSAHDAGKTSETEAQTLLNHANDAIASLNKADGKPECPTCGQPLTESHIADERQRRQAEVDRWTARKEGATTARLTAESRVKDQRRALLNLEKRQRELADRIQKETTNSTRASEEIVRAARECRKAYLAMPEAMRTCISATSLDDWAATTWPAPEDFDRLNREAGQCALAEERVKQLDQIVSAWRNLTTQASTLRNALAAHQVAIPEELPALRDAHARLEKEQKDTRQRLNDTRESLRREQEAIKILAAQIKSLEAEILTLRGQCDVERANQTSHDEAICRSVTQLPPEWAIRTAEISVDRLKTWKATADNLELRGIRESFKALTEARSTFTTIDERIKELEADIDRTPEAARQLPDSIASQLQQAKDNRAHNETVRQQAETRRGELQAARRHRQELEQSQLEADRRLRHLKLLCELLGKKRLQLHLVRQAERKIIEGANGILDRLSAGDLRLQLRGGEGEDATDQALDLVAIHRSTGGGQPIAVAFLSGSQRFRVAVSLALAIGQVAGNHRCGECVIIDEGFGSLDVDGQDVMINELQRLQGIMKRIILVSHQESFARAFPHGYRFEIQDGEARVQRMSS